MAVFLGLDTSNYTTSAALFDSKSNTILQKKQLLAVKDGALGLRQSDAVFSHIKQLGSLVEMLVRSEGMSEQISGVGVSVKPRDAQGSYMPCFLVGEMAAQVAASVTRLPMTRVSHQSGHIAAALFSSGRMDLIGKEFAAFHLSGGTTECLMVHPDQTQLFAVEIAARSLDLKAGQAVDRVGGMLGLAFPSGRELEKLALQSKRRYKIKPSFHGMDCSLSGVENRCRKLLENGAPACDVARYCIDSILAVVEQMTAKIKESFGKDFPIVYSGGVMSNSIIREKITRRFGGFFADPQYSSDNAAGVAVLACIAQTGGF